MLVGRIREFKCLKIASKLSGKKTKCASIKRWKCVCPNPRSAYVAWIKCRGRIKERNQTLGTSSISLADFSKDGLSAVLSPGAVLSAFWGEALHPSA